MKPVFQFAKKNFLLPALLAFSACAGLQPDEVQIVNKENAKAQARSFATRESKPANTHLQWGNPALLVIGFLPNAE
jgi:hypothetical protein